nr:recombinase family protein [Nocardioides sp. MAH-18]
MIYARISKDRVGAGIKVATQEADCRTLADRLGATVVGVYVDNDLSAYSGKQRPQYLALLERVAAGDADVVIAWHTDRLHRNPTELEAYIDACERGGVDTHTVRAGRIDLTTPSGKLFARNLGSYARFEIEHAIDRQRRAKRRAATEGTWKGGRRPFGYNADGVTVRDSEADAIREAADRVLAGDSLAAIAREWNRRGITTTTGKEWRPDGPRRILLRPRNAGFMEHQGEIIGEAEWPPVIEPEKWRAVTRLLTNPARRTAPSSSGVRWLGSGLYRCWACDGPVRVGASKGISTYRCRERSHVARAQEPLDDFVTKAIVRWLRESDRADLLWTPPGTDVGALETEAATLTGRKQALASMFARGEIDGPQLATATSELEARLEQIRDAVTSAYSGTALEGVASAPDPGQAWLDLPLDRQRAVLDAVVVVTLLASPRGRPAGWVEGLPYFRPDTVRLDWRSGD